MTTRLAIAALIYMMVNAVIYGTAAVTVLSVPWLNDRATVALPAVIIASFIIAVPVSWWLAPRLRLRFWRKREA